MTFLTSASIIWTEQEREEVHSMAVKYGPKGLAALCESAESEANFCKETMEECGEIDVNKNCNMEKVSNKEKIEEINEEQHCSDAILRNCNDVEETKDADSDDPSIIFIEEVRGNTEIVETAKNMSGLLKETSENLSKPSEFLNSKDNEFINGNSNLFHHALPELLVDKKFGSSKKGINESAKNVLFLSTNKVDGDAPRFSSPVASCVAPNVDSKRHLNDSIESLLRKLSPIKPLPSRNEELLSPVACCSEQIISDKLLCNLSPEKPISPKFTLKSKETRLSRNSLIKTKSSPEFLFAPKIPASPLSALSLLDRTAVSPNDVFLPPRETIFKRQNSLPEIQASRLVRRFEELDSDVKILKTKDITPMPVYDLMSDKELKVFILNQYHVIMEKV